MIDFIKKNIYLIFLFIITLSVGFLTFLTFIDKGLIELSNKNLQLLLILNIILLFVLFIFIFVETNKAIKNDIDKDGLKSNKKYITYFALFTLIPSLLISIFSLFLFSFALEKYFDKKVTTVVNNSYNLAKSYVQEVRNKVEADIILIAFDVNKSFLLISMMCISSTFLINFCVFKNLLYSFELSFKNFLLLLISKAIKTISD